MGFWGDLFKKEIPDKIEKVEPQQIKKTDSLYNLYRDTIFLNWCNGKEIGTSSDFYPKYFKYTFYINNPVKRHNELINNEYLSKPSNREILLSLKVKELKEILYTYNLNVSGKKAELVSRIISSTDYKPISNIYVLSEKGKKFINENFPFVGFYKSNVPDCISLEEYYAQWQDIKSRGWPVNSGDVFWEIIQMKTLTNTYNKNYDDIRQCVQLEFEILKKTKKTELTFYTALKIIILDLTGLRNFDIVNSGYYTPNIFIAPYYSDYINGNSDLYSDDLVDTIFERLFISNSFISKSEIKKIINDMISAPFSFDYDLTYYNDKLNI